MIKIVVLLENTTESSNLKCKHGFSLYAETEKHKILFDMGPNDFFLRNAETLGVDIADIDIAVLSDELPPSAYADSGFRAFVADRATTGV